MSKEWIDIYELIEKNYASRAPNDQSKIAIETFLGNSWIEGTVNHIIKNKAGWNLASNTLRILESQYATDYAYNIYKNSNNIEDQKAAVFLIKDIAHPKSINWVEEFIKDENVCGFGLGLLDQLLWREKVELNEQTEFLLELALKKENNQFTEHVKFIYKYLRDRENLN